jgi:outer membrane protein OmpA-like peptidoglycan-associated protein
MMVDQFGRAIDADHDGVDDFRDRCPDTPAECVVNEEGCPREMTILEEQLIDVGQFEERRIYFETGLATLQPESFPYLDRIGNALSGLPELRFEVQGHCDERGTDEFNQTLSEMRAQAVVDYLVQKFGGLSRGQFVARGFGKSRPVATGGDEASLAQNRRVEFLVLNREEARLQIQTKRCLRRGEEIRDSLRGE